VISAEEDPVSEKSEAGTSIDLAFQKFGFVVDAFGRSLRWAV
jgi:hypothetical protein